MIIEVPSSNFCFPLCVALGMRDRTTGGVSSSTRIAIPDIGTAVPMATYIVLLTIPMFTRLTTIAIVAGISVGRCISGDDDVSGSGYGCGFYRQPNE